ncbi:hypothetical protein [Rickettsia asembonensis]|uniref:hypothetical protein n=1 Tax=Rickettsia asembonensis TaxID=1068590 RepID=UPI0018F1549B|nr:hypothetical protein [Rickettsia asembonensis]
MCGLVKPTVSPCGLTTGSIKTIKNTNNFSIFNWNPLQARGMIEVKLIHATMLSCNDEKLSHATRPVKPRYDTECIFRFLQQSR